ncbi:Na(+)-translocating NADH-quinone reductase subunit C [Candidatus Latescibacterota bacterium]
MPRETVGKTLFVAFAVCVFFSVLVSAAAVILRPVQEVQKVLDKKRNILSAAGLLEDGKSIDEQYANIEARVIDLATGEYVAGVDAQAFDARQAARDPESSQAIPADRDRAGIKRRAKQACIYLVREGDAIDKVILPIYGKGLWSTLYGFIALDADDANTIRGLVYYEHGETPGLGGEVDNPRWQALWNAKRVFDAAGQLRISVVKGQVDPSRPGAQHQVDGLSGATITSRGIHDMLQYWLSADGFGPYINRLKTHGVG